MLNYCFGLYVSLMIRAMSRLEISLEISLLNYSGHNEGITLRVSFGLRLLTVTAEKCSNR